MNCCKPRTTCIISSINFAYHEREVYRFPYFIYCHCKGREEKKAKYINLKVIQLPLSCHLQLSLFIAHHFLIIGLHSFIGGSTTRTSNSIQARWIHTCAYILLQLSFALPSYEGLKGRKWSKSFFYHCHNWKWSLNETVTKGKVWDSHFQDA